MSTTVKFNSTDVSKVASKVSALGATTIRVDIFATQKNEKGECFVAFAGTDGQAQITERIVGATKSTENTSVYFGKEILTFAVKLASISDDLELVLNKASATLKAGSANIEVAYKTEDTVSPFIVPKQDEVIGRFGVKMNDFKKALAQGTYAAQAGTERSFTEAISFVPVKADDSAIIKIESCGMGNGCIGASELLAFETMNGSTCLNTFSISCKRVGIISHLEGDALSVVVTPTMAVFSTQSENVILPLFNRIDPKATEVTLPNIDKMYFNELPVKVSANVNKSKLLAALNTVQCVADADTTSTTKSKAVLCTTEKGKLVLESANAKCHIEVECDSVDGTMDRFGFNPKFAISALQASTEDVVKFSAIETVNRAGNKQTIVFIRYGVDDVYGTFFAELKVSGVEGKKKAQAPKTESTTAEE